MGARVKHEPLVPGPACRYLGRMNAPRLRTIVAFALITASLGSSAAGRAYNTTMAVLALRALGTKPKYDPLPVFAVVLKADYKTLPVYMTSFFPLAYLASGKDIPAEADEKIRALMVQDADGYLN